MRLKLVSIIYNRIPPFSSSFPAFARFFHKKLPQSGQTEMDGFSLRQQKENVPEGDQSDKSSSSSFTVAVRGAERPTRLPEPDPPPDEALDRTTRQIGP